MDPYNREWVLVSFSWAMYHGVSRICPNYSTDTRNMLLVNVFAIRVETTSIPQCAGLSGQWTWVALEDLFHQTHVNFSTSFVLLLLCLLVYWRHISFWFPGRVSWADVVFAASGSRMSHVAFLLPYTSFLLSATSTALLNHRHIQAQTSYLSSVHRCSFLRCMF